MKWTLPVLALFLLVLTGCLIKYAHGEKIRKVRPGMGMDEVHAIVGMHEGYKKEGNFEVISYYNKAMSSTYKGNADYHYIFESGKLVEYGAGEIRQDPAAGNKIVLIPLFLP